MEKNDEKRIAALIDDITKKMEMLIGDTSVPKNVRSAVVEAKNKLNAASGDYTVRVSGAIYNLDEVSNDINLPPQARTMIWNILSLLESVKE
jgi:uncharacterized protein (UPF0147 family)